MRRVRDHDLTALFLMNCSPQNWAYILMLQSVSSFRLQNYNKYLEYTNIWIIFVQFVSIPSNTHPLFFAYVRAYLNIHTYAHALLILNHAFQPLYDKIPQNTLKKSLLIIRQLQRKCILCVIFLQKYLVSSKKSSTFASAFAQKMGDTQEREHDLWKDVYYNKM